MVVGCCRATPLTGAVMIYECLMHESMGADVLVETVSELIIAAAAGIVDNSDRDDVSVFYCRHLHCPSLLLRVLQFESCSKWISTRTQTGLCWPCVGVSVRFFNSKQPTKNTAEGMVQRGVNARQRTKDKKEAGRGSAR